MEKKVEQPVAISPLVAQIITANLAETQRAGGRIMNGTRYRIVFDRIGQHRGGPVLDVLAKDRAHLEVSILRHVIPLLPAARYIGVSADMVQRAGKVYAAGSDDALQGLFTFEALSMEES